MPFISLRASLSVFLTVFACAAAVRALPEREQPSEKQDVLRRLAEQITDLAQQGDPGAQYMMGLLSTLSRDYRQAATWYAKAAEKGNAESQMALGMAYALGRGVPRDAVKAVSLIRQAAGNGWWDAQLTLGAAFLFGEETQRDPALQEWLRLLRAQWLSRTNNQVFTEAVKKGQVDFIAMVMLFVASEDAEFPQLGVAKDTDQAQKWIRDAADQNVWDAKFMLGFMFYHGRGVSQNYAEAAKWLSEPASRGHIGAQQLLGVMYYRGLGMAQDYATAYKLLDAPAANGDSESQLILGVMYTRGRGVEQDLVQAFAWFDLAARGNSPQAREASKNRDVIAARLSSPDQIEQARATVQFLEGRQADRRGDLSTALESYRRAADSGHARAQAEMGGMYASGRGVVRNETEAAKWLRRAADQGYADAQVQLAQFYVDGRGVSKNVDEAMKLFRAAAEKGSPEAACALGTVYAKRQDFGEAFKWWRRGAEQGHEEAQGYLALAYSKGRGIERSDTEALKWARMAAENGSFLGQGLLAAMYFNGQMVPKNMEQAYMWFHLASIAAARAGQKHEDVEQLEKGRDESAKQLSADQIKEAQRMASQWLMRAVHVQIIK